MQEMVMSWPGPILGIQICEGIKRVLMISGLLQSIYTKKLLRHSAFLCLKYQICAYTFQFYSENFLMQHQTLEINQKLQTTQVIGWTMW